MARILVLNGPNLNLLGRREPDIYGADGLVEIESRLQQQAQNAGHELIFFQSNAEHDLINQIHQAQQQHCAFIVINPAAFTHTSIALRDALLAVNIPFVEVHISNVFQREEFRRHSYFSDVAQGVISGLGVIVYELALTAATHHLSQQN